MHESTTRRRLESGWVIVYERSTSGDLRQPSTEITLGSAVVRPKRPLTVGRADDPAEREADRVASGVIALLNRADAPTTLDGDRAGIGGRIRRATAPPAPAPVAAGNPPGSARAGGETTADFATTLAGTRGRGESLDADTRTAMQGAFGTDLGHVRIHRSAIADRLSRSINARAMTVGSDIYFARGEYAPQRRSGAHLLAHELTHTLQNGGTDTSAHRQFGIRRRYQEHTVTDNAHLRDRKTWNKWKGPKISSGATIIAAPDNSFRTDDKKRVKTTKATDGSTVDVRWTGALNLPPNALGTKPISDSKAGFIRAGSIAPATNTDDVVKTHLLSEIRAALVDAEAVSPALAGRLAANGDAGHDKQIAFLFDKQLRASYVNGFNPNLDARALNLMPERLARVKQGARELAESLEHWRRWLHPEDPSKVTLDSVGYTGSDMHARGLGVVKAKFTKPVGGSNTTFPEKNVDVIIKPEDKTLEQKLIGADPADPTFKSAATKINEIVGIDKDPKQALTTIRMHSEQQWGAIIERVEGTSPDDLIKGGIKFPPVEQTFYETYVFAVLAGLDDLHKENVMWSDDDTGKPYLIDADNVLSLRIYEDKTNVPQTGFVGPNTEPAFTKAGSDAKSAVGNKDNSTISSEILEAMLAGGQDAEDIVTAIRDALNGQTCRIVPVRTGAWAGVVQSYAGATTKQRETTLDLWSSAPRIVREGEPADDDVGAGLIGVVGKHATNPMYNRNAERAQLGRDFRAGVIPFYEYDFATGDVTHNGTVVYRGVEAISAWESFIKARYNL